MATEKQNGLYIVLISVHGLIRGHDLELGRDSDTGGQTLYVVELARALARHPEVERVDLMTRRVIDPRVSPDYAEPEEDLGDGARIVRIDAGPEEYLRKEQLWDNLNCFVDGALDYILHSGMRPTLVHSHYADAGYVGARLAHNLGVPLVHTGHSLGRVKRRRLLAKGESAGTIEKTYAISRRIRAEEEALASSARVIVSTQHEIDEQYGLYDCADEKKMVVIPPGVNLERFYPAKPDDPPPAICGELRRFLLEPEKPIILALSRPDERKNIATLVRAYGENPSLRQQANLVVIAGNRDDIRDMDNGPRRVLTELLLLFDLYDLYGQVAYPRHHQAEDVPDLYRLVARTGGVFINPALTEPFGLTLIEAAACGAPLLATEDGGPRDIIGACHNGELIDPLDAEAMGERLLALIEDRERWRNYSRNGIEQVREQYSWDTHVSRYLEAIAPLLSEEQVPAPQPSVPDHALVLADRALVIELEALGDDPDDPALHELLQELRHRRGYVGFGISSDRPRREVLVVLKRLGVPVPDVLFSRSGSQIHYGPRLSLDQGWSRHIGFSWQSDRVYNLLAQTPGLHLEPRSAQGLHAIHATIAEPDVFEGTDTLARQLNELDISAHVVRLTESEILAMPVRASKGFALRYFAAQWDLPLEHILVAGGALTDEDMLRGNPLGAVVLPEGRRRLPGLTELKRVMFSKRFYVPGVLEAIDYYDFFGRCGLPEDSAEATDTPSGQASEGGLA